MWHEPAAVRIIWCFFQKLNVVVNWCVNLTGPRHAQIGGKKYFWVYLGRYFWKRWALESVDWVKITLNNVVGHRPIWGRLNRRKKLRKGEFAFFAWVVVSLLNQKNFIDMYRCALLIRSRCLVEFPLWICVVNRKLWTQFYSIRGKSSA